MRLLRILERRFLPNVRSKRWYKMTKFFLLAPIIFPYAIARYCVLWLIGQVKIRRNGKPDIILRDILDGWANYIIDDPVTEQMAQHRASICAKCPFAEVMSGVHTLVADNKTKQIRGMVCSKCSCPLSAKVRSSRSVCPIGKW